MSDYTVTLSSREYDAMRERIKVLESVLREWRDVQCDQVMSLPFMKKVDALLSHPSQNLTIRLVRTVGCEGSDGLLRVHPDNETCDVCRVYMP